MSDPKESESRFVLVAGIDMGQASEAVVANALVSVRGRPGAEIHLVHVLPLGAAGAIPQLLGEAREQLAVFGQRASDGGRARVTTHLSLGQAWREIVQVATHVHADLILVGTHGRTGVSHLVLGSQAELVVRNASCPVLVVREKAYPAVKVAEIEPACAACLSVQAATGGERLWCARHSQHHPRPHLHYEFPEAFARGSMLVQPE